MFLVILLLTPLPTHSTLFPYTTLFRSINGKVNVAKASGSATFKGINGNVFAGLQSIEQEGVTLRDRRDTSELQSQFHLVCRLLLEKQKKQNTATTSVIQKCHLRDPH